MEKRTNQSDVPPLETAVFQTDLDQGNAVVETHLDEQRLLLALFWLLTIVGSDSLSLFAKPSLLLLFGLWLVLVEETEKLGGGILV